MDRYNKIETTYGFEEELKKLEEECLELHEASVNVLETMKKFDIKRARIMHQDDLVSEMADVLICINHIINGLDCFNDVVREMDFKLDRQIKRIGAE